VDRGNVPKVDWNSSEKMREIDVYYLGMVVDYNVSNTVPGNGSCIFLHIWKGMGRGTAGCTAMAEENLEGLVQWVGHKPAALVQMPQPEYERLKKVWGLP
jgi:L,D-peptidoglycan transpeptidase YkuD (ErfK/YbiS/YcfS/YnhG family)